MVILVEHTQSHPNPCSISDDFRRLWDDQWIDHPLPTTVNWLLIHTRLHVGLIDCQSALHVSQTWSINRLTKVSWLALSWNVLYVTCLSLSFVLHVRVSCLLCFALTPLCTYPTLDFLPKILNLLVTRCTSLKVWNLTSLGLLYREKEPNACITKQLTVSNSPFCNTDKCWTHMAFACCICTEGRVLGGELPGWNIPTQHLHRAWLLWNNNAGKKGIRIHVNTPSDVKFSVKS